MRVLLAARHGAVIGRTRAISQLKALIVNAPEALREQLRRGGTDEQLDRCARLRTLPSHSIEHRAPVRAIRAVARRALALEAEAAEHESDLEELVTAACPDLLELPGVGAITAAQFLVSWSHSRRLRNEVAFAALAGVAPIPASSGQTVRHRLNRSGDRQLNRALHTVALSRLQHHRPTKTYAARRTAEGKTPGEIKRCLKRAIARNAASWRPTRDTKRRSTRRLDNHRSILAVALAVAACSAGYSIYFTEGKAPALGQAVGGGARIGAAGCPESRGCPWVGGACCGPQAQAGEDDVEALVEFLFAVVAGQFTGQRVQVWELAGGQPGQAQS
jgi:hypothetical protein